MSMLCGMSKQECAQEGRVQGRAASIGNHTSYHVSRVAEHSRYAVCWTKRVLTCQIARGTHMVLSKSSLYACTVGSTNWMELLRQLITSCAPVHPYTSKTYHACTVPHAAEASGAAAAAAAAAAAGPARAVPCLYLAWCPEPLVCAGAAELGQSVPHVQTAAVVSPTSDACFKFWSHVVACGGWPG